MEKIEWKQRKQNLKIHVKNGRMITSASKKTAFFVGKSLKRYWSVYFSFTWMMLYLSKTDIKFPVSAHGDLIALYALMEAYKNNLLGVESNIGFPFGLSMGSVPITDWFQQPLIMGLSQFLGTIAGVNLWWALSYPLTAGLSWRLGKIYTENLMLTNIFAIAVTFSPWHMSRQDHILLGTTWPFIVILILVSNIIRKSDSTPHLKRETIVLAIVTGLFSSYIGFFALLTTFGILLGQLISPSANKNFSQIKITIQVGIIQLFSYIATIIPTLVYKFQDQHQMFDAFARTSQESTLYAGSIFRLVSPYFVSISDYSNKILGNFFSLPGKTESLNPSNFAPPMLSVTLLLLLIWGLRRPASRTVRTNQIFILSVCTIWLLTWFLPGGLNLLFANLVSPQIRSWNRLAPLIQIMLMVIFICVFEIRERIKSANSLNQKIVLSLFFITIASIANPLTFGGTKGGYEKFSEMASLVNQITAEQQGKCGALQLPLSDFPEAGPKGYSQDYDQFWPYLIDSRFKGTYGILKSSYQNSLSKYDESFLLSPEGLKLLRKSGICGVIVDTLGYAEIPNWIHGFKVEGDIIYSKSRQYFYKGIGKDREINPSVLLRNQFSFAGGLSFIEANENQRWLWVTNSEAELSFYVKSPTLANLSFKSSLNSCGNPIKLAIYLNDKLISRLDVSVIDQNVNLRNLVLPKGISNLKITSSGKACRVDGDERTFYWRMIDPVLYLGKDRQGI